MKPGNKTGTKKKEEKKSVRKNLIRNNKASGKSGKIDTDFHHVHPFKEN